MKTYKLESGSEIPAIGLGTWVLILLVDLRCKNADEHQSTAIETE
jgi:diketogulonate reductase-like aldo/keto reductase